MLCQHFAAEGDAAIQSNGGKVRASRPLTLRPGNQGRNDPTEDALSHTDHRVIEAHSFKAGPIFRSLWAQLQELHDAGEVLTRGQGTYAGDVTHFLGQQMAGRGGHHRATIRNKKHRERDHRKSQNKCCHHRCTATSCAVAKWESSSYRKMVISQERGSRQASAGAK